MPCLTFLVLLVLACIDAAATEVYRWVDEDGNVIFSDVPRPGAEQIHVDDVSTVPAQPVPAQRTRTEATASGDGPAYDTLRIAAPADEATIRNQQQLGVEVRLDPALDAGAGHRIQFYYDGETYGEPVAATSTVVQPLERGTHKIGAAVVDASGKALLSAEPVTIYVHQTSILTPRPAVRAPSGS
ncbi:MAG: DUF4124 domain-containing protein [Gammaproteobacteria bacterium]